jgi:hypothetical protein
MPKRTIIIIFVIFASILFLGVTDKKDNTINQSNSNLLFIHLQKNLKHNSKIIKNQEYLKKSNQNLINNALLFASKSQNEISKLTGFCKYKEYVYETLDEQRRRVLKLYINIALSLLNKKCINFAKQINSQSFHFNFIEIINANSAVDKMGNSRWKTDIMIEESSLHLSLRLMIDFTVEIEPYIDNKGNNKIETCAEYTTFPFPKYFIGYPTLDQMIPLPTQIISTGSGLVLSQGGKNSDYPLFKAIYLNQVWMENSDLTLGTELPSTLFSSIPPAVNDSNLPSSKYPDKKFYIDDVQFPEKFYSDCLEKTGKAIDTDIYNKYTWKPPNYKCTGKSENSYHHTGNSESYKKSIKSNNLPSGWIHNAKSRNKWPKLWSEPRDRFEYPSAPVGYMWNNLGVRYPIPEPDYKNPGIRWSTQQAPRTPYYWPTLTGLPSNGGPNHWLFDQTRGVEANLPHGGQS